MKKIVGIVITCFILLGCSHSTDLSEYLCINNERGGLFFFFADTAGNLIAGPMYGRCSDFHEGLALLCRDKKYGYINTKGKEVIPLRYANAESFKDGIAIVRNDSDLCGVIDVSGKEIIAIEYNSIRRLSSGNLLVDGKKKKGIFHRNGVWVDLSEYTYISPLTDEYIIVRNAEGLRGWVNEFGEEKVPCRYKRLNNMWQGIADFETKDGQKGWVDIEGEEVYKTNKQYSYNPLSEGMSVVSYNNNSSWLHGYVDKSGEIVIPCQYKYAGDFSCGLAYVSKGGDYGYINKKGEVVIPFQYTNAYNFNTEGYAQVQNQKEVFYIDTLGNRIDTVLLPLSLISSIGAEVMTFDLVYQAVSSPRGTRVSSINNKGYRDESGNLIIPCVYNEIKIHTNWIECMKADGKHYAYALDGKFLFKY